MPAPMTNMYKTVYRENMIPLVNRGSLHYVQMIIHLFIYSSIHPFPTVWSTTEAWDLVLIVLNVELVVIAELVEIEQEII